MKIKQFIKNNWMMTLIYTLGLFGAILAGWLLGRPSMLHATAFSGSSITYNEGQILYDSTDQCYMFINQGTTYFYLQKTCLNSSNVYTGGTLSDNTITGFFGHSINGNTGNITQQYGTYTLTISSNSVNLSGGLAVQINENYVILPTGYTEAQYQAYGQQQYTAGQNSVINSPNTYGLYTSAQYNANYTSGQNSVLNNPNNYNLFTQNQYNAYGTDRYNVGYSAGSTAKENDILTNPNNYGLYSSAQYTAYGTSQYNAGLQYVQNNPNLYNLYTSAQYTAYGASQYNAGVTAGQNDVINNPHSYNLYTSTEYADNYTAGQNAVINNPHTYDLYTASEYNSYGTSQYNVGYLAGINDNEAYNLGIQHVLDNPHDYNLYTQTEYNNYGTSQYNAGVQYVVNNPNDYDLYNSAQYEAYALEQYNEGYSAGVDSYSYETIVPTFTGSFYYACTNNASPGGWCESANSITDLVSINFSSYANYTTNVAYPESMGNLTNTGYNIEQVNYSIFMDIGQSGSSVIAIPESVTDIYIQFCDGYNSYYIFGIEYTYCKSIATNVPNYSPSGAVFGIDDIYNNPGIYVGNINRIENGYRILELNNYLVGSSKNWRFLQVLLGDDSTIQTQYSNFALIYVSSPLDAEAYNYGYQTGYTNGNAIGSATAQKIYYAKGYDDGFNKARVVGDSSLVGVTGTILSAPVNMFKSIFNVDFLGVNLAGFILSIVTLFIAIWLIKKFL